MLLLSIEQLFHLSQAQKLEVFQNFLSLFLFMCKLTMHVKAGGWKPAWYCDPFVISPCTSLHTAWPVSVVLHCHLFPLHLMSFLLLFGEAHYRIMMSSHALGCFPISRPLSRLVRFTTSLAGERLIIVVFELALAFSFPDKVSAASLPWLACRLIRSGYMLACQLAGLAYFYSTLQSELYFLSVFSPGAPCLLFQTLSDPKL